MQVVKSLVDNLLFIHGAWHWSGCWYKIVNSSLLDDCRIYALDNVGHGFSKRHEAKNFDEYTSNIQNLINSTKGKFTIIAHSMGGSIASFIANKFPSKIKKIIYVAASMCAENKCAIDYFMEEHYFNFMREQGLENLVIPDTKEQFIKLNIFEKAKVIKLFYNQSSELDVGVALRNLGKLNSVIPFAYKHNYCKEFHSIHRVYVECTNDNAMPIVTQRQMQQQFPGAKTYTLDTDHSPFFSKDQELSEIIKKETSFII
jgi:pimeloyl-ACP methyl ester carboxylesterase